MYPPHHLGGYELACRDAVTRWRSRGHDVTVLTGDTRFPHAIADPGDDAIRELRLYWRDGIIVVPGLRERLSIERANLAVLRRVLADVHPDVVSVWHAGATSLGLLTELARRELPAVFVLGDLWLVYGPEVDAWTNLFRRRRAAWSRGAVAALTGTHTSVEIGPHTAACFASSWLKHVTEQRSPLPLPAHRTVVYGGIDHDAFAAPDPPRPFAWRLLYTGRVEERKGVHVAIEAMPQLPNATLDIYGSWDDQTYVDRLKERARALGIDGRVRWHGQVPRAELGEAYRSSDVFLFPVVWDEPFGMVPLEAMASGVVVVGTGTGGSGEFLVDNVNCLRVTPGDPSGLADAVRMLADDELRVRLSHAGLATASYFDDDLYARELEAWHVAAAERFAAGVPVPRPPLAQTIAALTEVDDPPQR